MTTAWLLNSFSLLATTVAALLIFLYLWKTPRAADAWQSPEGKLAYQKHRQRLVVSVGLLAAWLLLQDLTVILL